MKFQGTEKEFLEFLQNALPIIKKTEYSRKVHVNNDIPFFQYKFYGYIINFYPSTGTILPQGKPKEKEQLTKRLCQVLDLTNYLYRKEKSWKANDGHRVRSKNEKIVDDWLYEKGIVHAYETEIPNMNGKLCDFYIPSKEMYVEVWTGFSGNFSESYKATYDTSKQEKIEHYKSNKLNWIGIEEDDLREPNKILSEIFL